MEDIDLSILTDEVREIKAAIERTAIEEQSRDGKKVVVVSADTWEHVYELIYQIDKMNNYKT